MSGLGLCAPAPRGAEFRCHVVDDGFYCGWRFLHACSFVYLLYSYRFISSLFSQTQFVKGDKIKWEKNVFWVEFNYNFQLIIMFICKDALNLKFIYELWLNVSMILHTEQYKLWKICIVLTYVHVNMTVF